MYLYMGGEVKSGQIVNFFSVSQYDIHSFFSTSHLASLNVNQKTIRAIRVAPTVVRVVELCKRDMKADVVAASVFKP